MNETSVWSRMDTIEDRQLELLVASAVAVLKSDAPDRRLALVDRMPRSVLASELVGALAEAPTALDASAAERVVSDDTAGRDAAIAALRAIASEPALAAEVERVYEARRGMQVIEGGALLGPALLLLVLKLKRVRVARSGVDIEFHDVKADVLERLEQVVS